MNDSERVDDLQENHTAGNQPAAHPRAVGSPLARGSVGRTAPGESETFSPRPPVRVLNSPPASVDPQAPAPSNLQRAVNAFRTALPFVQRLLPLLDGNVAGAVVNVLTHHPQKSAPSMTANLAPLEGSVAELQAQQRDLREQVIEQNSSLKRVEDQLEGVRDATDRNTLEQRELVEDLKAVSRKVNRVALIAVALLLISVVLNLVLYLRIQHVLP